MRPAWQPIETAPTDGTQVLLCCAVNADGQPIHAEAWGLFVQVAAWWAEENDGEGAWIVYCSIPAEPELHFAPTHWALLPEPPQSAAKPGERSEP